jgi:hypothetical protein
MNKSPLNRNPDSDASSSALCAVNYPDDFTLADRTAERMTRARNGLAHVMTDLDAQPIMNRRKVIAG